MITLVCRGSIFLKNKSEYFTLFLQWKKFVELQSGRKLIRQRHDAGGEYISKEYIKFCADNGVELQYTQTATSSQNGVAERFNRTLQERIRSILNGSQMSSGLWHEAAACVNYTQQRVPHSSLPTHQTPYELWHGHKPNVSHLQVFGAVCTVHVQDSQRQNKLSSRALLGRFVGYGRNKKGYRIWTGRKIINAKDVLFFEQDILDKNIVSLFKFPPVDSNFPIHSSALPTAPETSAEGGNSTDHSAPLESAAEADEPDILPQNTTDSPLPENKVPPDVILLTDDTDTLTDPQAPVAMLPASQIDTSQPHRPDSSVQTNPELPVLEPVLETLPAPLDLKLTLNSDTQSA